MCLRKSMTSPDSWKQLQKCREKSQKERESWHCLDLGCNCKFVENLEGIWFCVISFLGGAQIESLYFTVCITHITCPGLSFFVEFI